MFKNGEIPNSNAKVTLVSIPSDDHSNLDLSLLKLTNSNCGGGYRDKIVYL